MYPVFSKNKEYGHNHQPGINSSNWQSKNKLMLNWFFIIWSHNLLTHFLFLVCKWNEYCKTFQPNATSHGPRAATSSQIININVSINSFYICFNLVFSLSLYYYLISMQLIALIASIAFKKGASRSNIMVPMISMDMVLCRST